MQQPTELPVPATVQEIPDNSYIVRPTTDEEKQANMPYITASMLEAINTCPKWGIIRNVHNRHFTTGYRQMALEAGSLMHEVFSMLNLFQVGVVQKLPEHMAVHGTREFGVERWMRISQHFSPEGAVPETLQLERAMFELMATTEFYDDDNDRNRTLSNLEHCALELIAYWLMHFRGFNIYIADENDPTAEIGVEKSLDVVFISKYGTFRFIGLIDALYQNPVTKLVTSGEYKTTSSMNDAWAAAFQTRHQITAYSAALNAYFDNVSGDTILLGSSIPVRKTTTPVQHFPVYRDNDATMQFLQTVAFTNSIKHQYIDNPIEAPMFTHSCMRYFRPCALLDLCASPKEDQIAMFDQMLIAPTASPSEQKALLQRD